MFCFVSFCFVGLSLSVLPLPEEAFPYLQTKTHNDPRGPTSQRVSVFWSKRRGGGGGGKKRKRQESDGADSRGVTG